MTRTSLPSRVTAVLGPTNTGKTHLAITRMLGHETGMIGFPLRLLARENYERIVAEKGRRSVALITGEEKIIPADPKYIVCTVESMPTDREVDFLAVDEIQLCGDRERGHVFTDRLLSSRGREETMFLGSETVRPLLQKLIPTADLVTRPRFSTLSYIGARKLTRLPPRSAVVAFSAQEVYALAELVRRHRGGTAVVLGALSPRTRNAQVEMYQSGEVDYLIATDAIGMGLNMDVDHVAFASDTKFDGRAPRRLAPAELAQIAGRAGRHMNDGTFGVTGDCRALDEEEIERIENHEFDALKSLYWRSSALSFNTVRDLRRSLENHAELPFLIRKRDAEDQQALEALSRNPDVMDRVRAPARVRLLWEICQIPDFRRTLTDSHTRLLAQIFDHLTTGAERLPPDWVSQQIKRFDRTDGDIDTLINRIAHIRTWTYITHRGDWISDPVAWQQRTRAIEDRLSDALHAGLTQRFVDKRAAVLVRKLKDKDLLSASVDKEGRVSVEGHDVGQIDGLSFDADGGGDGATGKAVETAARKVLPPELARRVRQLIEDEDTFFGITAAAELQWRGSRVGSLEAGADTLAPRIRLHVSDMIEPAQREQIEQRLRTWLDNYIATRLPGLDGLTSEDLPAPARGVAFQLREGLGSVRTAEVESLVSSLDQDARKALGRLGVRFGVETVHMPELLKPRAVDVRAVLWSTSKGIFPEAGPPPAGRVTVARAEDTPDAYYLSVGYVRLGEWAIRAEMVERTAVLARRAAREGHFKVTDEMLSLVAVPRDAMTAILNDLGFRRVGETEEGESLYARRRRQNAEGGDGEGKRRRRGPRRSDNRAAPGSDGSAPAQNAEAGATDMPAIGLFGEGSLLPDGGTGGAPADGAPQQDGQDGEKRRSRGPRRRGKKPGQGQSADGGGDKTARDGNNRNGGNRSARGGDDRPRNRGKRPDRRSDKPRVVSAGRDITPDDSPFAVLKNLNLSKKGDGQDQ